MSNFPIEDLKKVAELARIELTEQELNDMSADMGSILGFIDIIQKTDTAGVIPTSQVTGLADVWREDVVRPSPIKPKELLAGSPLVQDGYVKVKKVL